MRLFVCLFVLFILGSCTFGPHIDDTANASLNATANTTVNTTDGPVGSDMVNRSEAGNASNVTTISPQARLNTSVLGIVPSDDATPRIVSFSLIDPRTNTPIQGYENMTGTLRIDRESVPSALALRANYAGDVVSVLFALDDDENFRVENTPPFALHGDEFASYNTWYPNKGRYVITATPYEGPDARSDPAEPTSITIEFFAEDYLDRVNNP